MPRIDVLWYELEARSGKYLEGLEEAETAAGKFTEFIKAHPVAVLASLTAAFVTAALKAAEFADKIEVSMIRVGNVMPAARGHIDGMRDALIDMSKTIPLSIEELAKGLERVAALGATGPGDALEKLRVAAQASVGTGADLDATLTTLQRTMQAFNIPAAQSARTMDTLMAAVQHGVPMQELETILARTSVVANQNGVSLDKVVAAVIALREAGTPMRQIVAEFGAGMSDVNKGMLGAEGLTGRLASRVQFLNGQIKLTGAGANDYAKSIQAVADNTGAADDAARRYAQTAEGQAKLIRNNLAAAWIDFGNRVLPLVTAELRGVEGIMWRITGGAGAERLASAAATVLTLGHALRTVITSTEDLGKFNRAWIELAQSLDKGVAPIGLTRQQITQLMDEFEKALPAAMLRAQVNRDKILATLREALVFAPPDTGPRAGGTGGAGGDTTAQTSLKEEITARLAGMTGTAAQIASAAIDKLYAKAHEVFGDKIPADIAAMFEQLRAAVSQDAALDKIDQKWKEIQADSAVAITQFKEGIGTPLLDEFAALEQLEATTRAQMEAAKAAGNTQMEEKLAAALREQEKLRREIGKLIGNASAGEADQNRILQERIRILKEQARNIEEGVKGATELAMAFGLMDEDTGKLLDNLGQAVASIKTIAGELKAGGLKAVDFSSLLSAAGAVAGLVGSLFGESPAEKAMKETMAKNTEAIVTLTRTLGEFGLAMTGQEFGKAGTGAAALLTGDAFNRMFESSTYGRVGTGTIDSILGPVGTSFAELKKEAEALGITLDTTNLFAFRKSLEALQKALAETQLTQFAQTFTGQLEALDAQFKLFDITDPIKQLEELRKVLTDPKFGAPALASALGGLDLSTPEGRAKADAAIQALFQQLQAGTLAPAGLGGLTPEQLLSQLEEIHKLINQANNAGGVSQSFGIQQSITQITGDRISALLTTSTVWLQMIEEHTRVAAFALAAISVPQSLLAGPPASPAPGTLGGIAFGSLTIVIQMTGSSPAETQRVGTEISGQLLREIDKALGAEVRRRALQSGSIIK